MTSNTGESCSNFIEQKLEGRMILPVRCTKSGVYSVYWS